MKTFRIVVLIWCATATAVNVYHAIAGPIHVISGLSAVITAGCFVYAYRIETEADFPQELAFAIDKARSEGGHQCTWVHDVETYSNDKVFVVVRACFTCGRVESFGFPQRDRTPK